MSPSFYAAATAALAFTDVVAATLQYTLANDDNYSGTSFWDGFDFITTADLNYGFVSYQSKDVAESSQLGGPLIETFANGSNYMGVDYWNEYEITAGRPSVRIETSKQYQYGLFVADLAHMPASVCGTWPAFWTVSHVDYPSQGEIDILENIHENTQSLETLHTSANCSVVGNQLGTQQSAIEASYSCDDQATFSNYGSQSNYQGCSATNSDPNSYGSTFNANSGGVYALEWTNEVIQIWNFAPNNVPSNLKSGKPDTSTWGTPQFTTAKGSCDIDSHFKDQQVVFNTNFCGSYAGLDYFWQQTSCYKSNPTLYATCNAYVAANPATYKDSYWTINSLKVYQKTNVTSSSSSSTYSSTATSTSSSTSKTSTTTTSPTSTTTSKTSSTTSKASTSSISTSTTATSSSTTSNAGTSSTSTTTTAAFSSSSSKTSSSSLSTSNISSTSTTEAITSEGTSSSTLTTSYSVSTSSTSSLLVNAQVSSSSSIQISSSISSSSSTPISSPISSVTTSLTTIGNVVAPSSSSSATSSRVAACPNTYKSSSSSVKYSNTSIPVTPTSPSATTGLSTTSFTTSTVYSTSVYTITSCAPTVTNCPVGHVTTDIISLYTTVCPVTATETSSGFIATKSPYSPPPPPESVTSTVYTTNVYTVKSGQVTTEIIPLYTTVYPYTPKGTHPAYPAIPSKIISSAGGVSSVAGSGPAASSPTVVIVKTETVKPVSSVLVFSSIAKSSNTTLPTGTSIAPILKSSSAGGVPVPTQSPIYSSGASGLKAKGAFGVVLFGLGLFV